MKFPFIGQAYQDRSVNVEAQECVNLYLEVDPNGRTALIGTPGLKQFVQAGMGPLRGLYKIPTGDVIAVSGNSVYRLGQYGAITLLGNITSASGPVSMADNGQQCVLVDGTSSGWQIDLTTYVLTAISDPAFYGADNVWFLDGRLIFNRPGTGQFYVSRLNAVTFDPLYFATAESSPDNLIAHIVDHREIWLFGDLTTEVWADSGLPDFPYERMQGAFLETGCAAAHSVCKMDNSLLWLGKDDKGQGIVWRVQNYTPTRISTHALEYAIASYARIDDALAYTYQMEGHTFYVLTFPTASVTWVYDAATQAWHQRAWLDENGRQQRHRSNCHCFAWGKNLVGDYQSGTIYQYDLNTNTDNGATIRRSRSCAPVQSDNFDWQYFWSLQIDMETGVGLSSGQGSDPQALLQWSDDGGHTWSNEHPASLGAMGQYKARARWNRMGRSRDRVFRVAVTDPVKVILIGAALNQGH